MHIADGVLPGATLLAGGAVALGVGAWSLKAVLEEDAPRVALVTAACFCASHLSIPLGPTSVHLLLSGLAGVVLGRAGFIAAAVAVLLQTALFQHGGLTALGVNITTIGSAALVAGVVFDRRSVPADKARRAATDARWAAAAAGVGTLVAVLLYGVALRTAGEPLAVVWKVAVAWNLALVPIEALVSASTIRFLARVEPRLVRPPRRAAHAVTLPLAAALLVLTLCPTAQAHRLDLDVVAHPDGRVAGEAFFSNGRPLPGGQVEVRRVGQTAPLATGTTDQAGAFLVRIPVAAPAKGSPPPHVVLEITVNDGAGHRAVARCPVTLAAPSPTAGPARAGRRATDRAGGAAPVHARSPGTRGKADWLRLALGLLVIASLGLLLAAWKRRQRARASDRSPEAEA